MDLSYLLAVVVLSLVPALQLEPLPLLPPQHLQLLLLPPDPVPMITLTVSVFQDVTKRNVVYLGWPIAPLVYEPKCGGGGVTGYRQMSTAEHRSPNKLWRSNSIFNLWCFFLNRIQIGTGFNWVCWSGFSQTKKNDPENNIKTLVLKCLMFSLWGWRLLLWLWSAISGELDGSAWRSVPDPDPYVFGPPGSANYLIQQVTSTRKKNWEKKIDFYCFLTSLWLFIFEEWSICTFKKHKK